MKKGTDLSPKLIFNQVYYNAVTSLFEYTVDKLFIF